MVRHLYLHIPFCHHICPYCAFYKHTPGRLANRAFVDAILTEAEIRAADYDFELETIYFGGGTPSLLSKSHLDRLCSGLVRIFQTDAVSEWTIEANPATFGVKKAALMRQLGINRASLGVQSFQNETLKMLGRDHSPDDAISAYEDLREAGFENIGVDQMFSIPGQTAEMWASDLAKVCELKPEHISCYNLTYEEDTDFLQRHESGELDDDDDRNADFFYQAIDHLEGAGFQHYEISNYARPGLRSKHNQAYWRGADYLGLGPGAVSTIAGKRWKTIPDTAAYVTTADTRTEHEDLSEEDLRLEAIALRLRTSKGVPTGLLPRPNPVRSLIQQGLVEEKDGHVFLTREGKALADPVTGMLV